MSSGNPKRTRSDRVAAVVLPKNWLLNSWELLRRPNVLLRVGLAAAAMFAMWAMTGAWAPPMAYRKGEVLSRAVVARVNFQQVDVEATNAAKEAKAREVPMIYEHDPQPLIQRLAELKGKALQIVRAESFETLDNEVKVEFFERAGPDAPMMAEGTRQDLFDSFRLALEDDQDLLDFEAALARAVKSYLNEGLLESLEHTSEQSTLLQIQVRPAGTDQEPELVPIEQVRIGEILPELQAKLASEFRQTLPSEMAVVNVSAPVYYWLAMRLQPTLHLQLDESLAMQEQAKKTVPDIMQEFVAGESILASAGIVLDEEPLSGTPPQRDGNLAYRLLEAEHRAYIAELSPTRMLIHSLADLGMYVAMSILCGVYVYVRRPDLLTDLRRYCTLLGTVVATVGFTWLASMDEWRAEVIPLVVFAMAVAIAYKHELALLLCGAVCLIFTVSARQGLADFTVLLAAMSASILLMGRIRTRTKLLYVGIAAGVVTAMTALGVGTLNSPGADWVLMQWSLWLGFCVVVAGLLMTGLLPFVESLYDTQTDISLLELGDAAHPLLQELVRRAPGTYNHSINVASIAEAAADAIGANGLLCRVGAYFHDIGKMLKPGYFIENQADGENRHDQLEPAMSTLVIIAHVKDGADLARQHGLPQSMINFIQQHHGTTLVEYFYKEASRKSEDDPNASEVEESDFRYPGPKPQSKEAAVMMLADSVESASRTLTEPTPARIESLVEKLAKKRLLDQQFDESGLTLSELRIVQNSLVKSLTAVYHGRVKYPEQKAEQKTA